MVPARRMAEPAELKGVGVVKQTTASTVLTTDSYTSFSPVMRVAT